MNSIFLFLRGTDRPDKATNSLASHHECSLRIPQPYGQHDMLPKNRDIYKGFITISHHVKVACGYMAMGNILFQDLLGVKEHNMDWEAR